MKIKKNPKKGICLALHCSKQAKHKSKYCPKCRANKYRTENPERAAFINLKHSAKKRGIPFDLSFDDFLRFCFTCDFIAGQTKERRLTASVDRINDDPAKGYHGYRMDNIQKLTVGENSSKYRAQVNKKLVYDYTNPSGAKVFTVRPLGKTANDPF